MPDMIWDVSDDNPILQRWADELCASCLVVEDCPLVMAIKGQKITTYAGIHVAECDRYDADTSSEYYIAPDASLEDIQAVGMELQRQQLANMLGDMKFVRGDIPWKT